MNQTEFMDLLRYYFRRVSEAELQEILSDYESHFKEGKARGLSEEEICRELGSPKAVYEMYLHEGMIHEKEGVPLPDAAAGKAQAAWERSGKDVPGALGTASGLFVKLLFSACYAAGFLVIVLTLFIAYLFSGAFFPALSTATLLFLSGAGLFAGLALIFAGSEIRRRAAPSEPEDTGDTEEQPEPTESDEANTPSETAPPPEETSLTKDAPADGAQEERK